MIEKVRIAEWLFADITGARLLERGCTRDIDRAGGKRVARDLRVDIKKLVRVRQHIIRSQLLQLFFEQCVQGERKGLRIITLRTWYSLAGDDANG